MSDIEEPQSEGELIRMTYRMVKDLKECKDDHENRLRIVEKQQFKWIGRDGMVVAGISGLVALCTIAGALVALKGGW